MTALTTTPDTRVRWRITLGELCTRCGCTAGDLDHWASLGALGPRLTERRDRAWTGHITRETAQRAVLMSRLLAAGMRADIAARVAVTHERGVTEPLRVRSSSGDVVLTLNRTDLP